MSGATTPATDLQPLLIGYDELATLMGVSRATVHRMASAGKIGPKPLKLSGGCTRWHRPTIERWLDESQRAGRLIERQEWLALEAGRENGL